MRFLVSTLLIGFATVQGCGAVNLSKAEMCFKRLQSLTGSWKISDPQTPSKAAFRISYKLISRDSALVETFGDPDGPVTETVYHLDGENLMATHYCAQGNQPRLRLQGESTDTALHFSFLDITNLKHAEDSHLIDLRFSWRTDGKIEREETYIEAGKKDVSTLLFERVVQH